MSANASVLGRPEAVRSSVRDRIMPQPEAAPAAKFLRRSEFAQEQIRGLVRRTFLIGREPKARQIVFAPLEAHFDITSICARVAQALASESGADVALVEGMQVEERNLSSPAEGAGWIKASCAQTSTNLWCVPTKTASPTGQQNARIRWLSFLADLRREFEYCVIQGPAVGTSSDAALLGQLTDGIILVLGAHSTRKAAARKTKEVLQGAESRILGTVLSERTFPIPERLYRRL
jgi:hypothetical protein